MHLETKFQNLKLKFPKPMTLSFEDITAIIKDNPLKTYFAEAEAQHHHLALTEWKNHLEHHYIHT